MSSDLPASHFSSSSCLVTGGAGFIGSNLVRALLAGGARVVVVDDLSTGDAGHLPSHPHLTLIAEDLCRMDGLADRVAEADFVFHLAAQVGNVKSIHDVGGDAERNVMGTVRLLEACRDSPPDALVYSSSSAIFGEARTLPIGEDHPFDPASFYALSKLTGERYVRLAVDLLGLPGVCLRYFNVFGLPMLDSEYSGVIPIFLHRLAAGEGLVIYGDGEQSRDFVFVDDVVQANLRAAARARPGSVYNVGTGTATTVRELAEAAMEVVGRKVPVEHRPPRAGEVRHSVADVARARGELGYEPFIDLRRGLGRVWRSMQGETGDAR